MAGGRVGIPFAVALVLHAGALVIPFARSASEPPPPSKVTVRLSRPPEPPEPPPPLPPPPPPPPVVEPPPPPPPPRPEPERLTRAPRPTPPPEPTPAPAEPPPPPEPIPPVLATPKPPPPQPRVEPTPPPTPSPPVTTRPSVDEMRGLIRGYGRGVVERVEDQLHYPAAARRLRLEGVAKIRVKIDRRGRLVGAPQLAQSTGHDVLDREALETVHRAAPFEELPDDFPNETAKIVIPVEFSMRR